MKTKPRRRLAGVAFAVIVIFVAALLVGWVHDWSTRRARQAGPRPVGTSGTTPTAGRAGGTGSETASPALPAPAPVPALISELRARDLQVPIEGADVERWKGSFAEIHGGHPHEAVDILAPRNTPIHAVADGRVAKLFLSRAGGLTVYEADASGHFIYYYAHLERYADSLHDGDPVTRGEVIGYVGTSGDAPPDTPHLHFAIMATTNPQRWWEGTAVDPYLVFTKER